MRQQMKPYQPISKASKNMLGLRLTIESLSCAVESLHRARSNGLLTKVQLSKVENLHRAAVKLTIKLGSELSKLVIAEVEQPQRLVAQRQQRAR